MPTIFEKEWWTGRNEIYLDSNKVQRIQDDLNNIKEKLIPIEKENCQEAINALNLLTKDYVCEISADSFDGVYEQITSAVAAISQQVSDKVKDIQIYSNASWIEKLTGTVTMTGAKFGEGIISVFESIGDAVISVGGFACGIIGAKNAQDALGTAVKFNFSRWIFSGYYNTDLAKKSVYTEDSGTASIIKTLGETAGYLAIGGFVSGAAGAKVANLEKLGKSAGKFTRFLSGTTGANTMVAGVGGLGQGTEAGLNAGLDYNKAFGLGAVQGLAQSGLAYGFGKLGEKGQKRAAEKAANQELARAKNNYDAIKETITSNSQPKKVVDISPLNDAHAAVTKAEEALAKVKSDPLSAYQGYTDSITKAGQKAGASWQNNVTENGLIKGTVSSANASLKNVANKVVNPRKLISGNLGEKIDIPLDGNKTLNSVKQAYNNLPKPLRAGIDLTGRVATSPLTPAANAIGEVAKNQATKGGEILATGLGVGGLAGKTYLNYQSDLAHIGGEIEVGSAQINNKLGTMPENNAASNGNPQGGSSGNGNTSNNNQYYNSGGGNSGTSYNPTTPPTTINPVTPNNPVTPVEPVTPTEPVTPPEPTTPTEPTTPIQPTTPTKPTTPENPGTTITNPEPTPTPPVRSDNGGSNSGVDHGGNYENGTGNIWSGTTDNGEVTEPELPDGELPIEEPTDTELPGTEESVYTIPTDLSGVTTKKKSSSGSSVIPILGGLGAAAAVGVGAKIYMDNKKNNDNGEDDDYNDDFEFKDDNNNDLLADEWKEDNNDDASLNFNDIVNDASEDNNDLGEI